MEENLYMFLAGNAKHFCQCQPDLLRDDLDALKNALREAFTSPQQTFLRRQELNMRKQGHLEPLELTDTEAMQCCMQGLRQEL